MENEKITELLFNRDERGLSALKSNYERLIIKIGLGLLHSRPDAEECANDTLLAVWNSIPPDRPDDLQAYVCKIARRKNIDKLRYNTAAARNLDLMMELDECVPSGYSIEDKAEAAELSRTISEWLKNQKEKPRKLFTLRYFYAESVKNAACECNMSENSAAAALMRMRKSLKNYLIERGMFYE